MTETEDRLTDALHAAARTVTAPGLRPLDESPAPGHSPAGPRAGRRWLAAIASAAAVALIAGLVVAVSARLRTSPGGGSGAPPRYYVGIGPREQLVVRATATGHVTSVVRSPRPGHLHFTSRLAAAGDRTFFAEVTSMSYTGARIYRFRVTAAGRAVGLAPLPGGTLPRGRFAQQMAASPDGSRLAVGLRPDGYRRSSPHAEIIVINTRTGARTAWAGAQAPPGESAPSLTFLQLSWTGNGRELAYLAAWVCKPGRPNVACLQPGRTDYEEIRALDPARGGGSLDSGRLLLRRAGGGIEDAAITADGSALTTVVVHDRAGGSRLITVAQVPAGTSGRARILYRLRATTHDQLWSFVPGKAGQFLILIGAAPRFSGGTVNGWIADGRLHRLPFPDDDVYAEVW